MREIKFRAWDKKMKVMEDWSFLRHESPAAWSTDLILMQYTGLKDKNGKEIYEGDILEFENDNEDSFMSSLETIRREVKWQDYYGAGWYFGLSHKDGMKRWSYPFPLDCEVIGNIYSNPDLLEQE